MQQFTNLSFAIGCLGKIQHQIPDNLYFYLENEYKPNSFLSRNFMSIMSLVLKWYTFL